MNKYLERLETDATSCFKEIAGFYGIDVITCKNDSGHVMLQQLNFYSVDDYNPLENTGQLFEIVEHYTLDETIEEGGLRSHSYFLATVLKHIDETRNPESLNDFLERIVRDMPQ